jgi:uncharacterized protein (DUF362 family)
VVGAERRNVGNFYRSVSCTTHGARTFRQRAIGFVTASQPEKWMEASSDFDEALWLILDEISVSVFDASTESKMLEMLAESISSFVGENFRGGYVLLKTSTAGDRSSSHEVSTSLLDHILRHTSRLVPAGSIIIADGPANSIPYESECKRLGWQDLIGDLGVAVVDLNVGPAREVVANWPVSSCYLDADLVINLTKAKTHRRFGVSLAEKSLLGTLSGGSLGYPKLKGRHALTTWLLRHIYASSPPILSIIDGINGIEGEGPLAGIPTKSHFLAYGVGCLAPDLRATIEMGFDPALVPLFHRPLKPSSRLLQPDWKNLRRTDVDFLPSASSSWLYHSLRRSRRREIIYQRLMKGAQECWPAAT